MNHGQKRQSCESCRMRKLKCSGEKTGCSRCLARRLPCRFQNKGPPGRPRKHDQVRNSRPMHSYSHGKEQTSRYELYNIHERPSATSLFCGTTMPSLSAVGQPSPASRGSSQGSSTIERNLPALQDYGEFGSFNFDFNTSEEMDRVPFQFFDPCLQGHAPFAETSNDHSLALTPPTSPRSCDCSDQVFMTVRQLRQGSESHASIGTLRRGIDIMEQLLRCPICYDTTMPPRITLQNVILIGRLGFELTSGYLRYLEWFGQRCENLKSKNECEIVYFATSGACADTGLSFEMSCEKAHEIVLHGIRSDVDILHGFGAKFEVRQHNRHQIGHEQCPDSKGQCRKEESDMDVDPSDVCPHSAVATALIPCYRVVQEVRSRISEVEAALRLMENESS